MTLPLNNNKEVKNLYSGNCKTLKKEIEEDTNKWKDILCSCNGIINMVKMSQILKQSTYSISFKIPMTFLTEMGKNKTMIQFMENHKCLQIFNAMLSKSKDGGIFPDIKLY